MKSKEECKALLKTKDWRDAYDELGNPLYDTTGSEQSSDIEECHVVVRGGLSSRGEARKS